MAEYPIEKGDDNISQTHNSPSPPRRQSSVVKEENVASVELSKAVEAQKPSLLSKNMLKLYMIMAIGYLVSTMNGFGTQPDRFYAQPMDERVSQSASLLLVMLNFASLLLDALVTNDYN